VVIPRGQRDWKTESERESRLARSTVSDPIPYRSTVNVTLHRNACLLGVSELENVSTCISGARNPLTVPRFCTRCKACWVRDSMVHNGIIPLHVLLRPSSPTLAGRFQLSWLARRFHADFSVVFVGGVRHIQQRCRQVLVNATRMAVISTGVTTCMGCTAILTTNIVL
jgi:hypothetical protein